MTDKLGDTQHVVIYHAGNGVYELLPAMRPGTIATGMTEADCRRIYYCVMMCRGISNEELHQMIFGAEAPNNQAHLRERSVAK